MPFFESASEYRVNGGNFQNVQGDINERYHNNSVKVDGQGNAVTYHHGLHQNGSGSNITNNNSGSMTIIGQGDNARLHLSHFDFPGNNGIFQMPPYPQAHISMPQNNFRHAAFPYSPQDSSRYFDPRMGYPQQFVPEQTMYQPDISHANQFPTAYAPSATSYTAGPINMVGSQTPSTSWNEPPETTRSNVTTEYPVDFTSFYNPAAPLSSPPMMPVPSTPLQIPSSVPVPVPLPTPTPALTPPPVPPFTPAQAPTPELTSTSIQMPIPPQNISSGLSITSHVAPPSIPSPNFPQERAITPPTPHSPVHRARTEVHESSSDLSHDTTHWNSTTPYAHRAVDQTHAHETAQRQDEVSVPHSVTSSNPTEERRLDLERISNSSTSHRPSSVQQPSGSEAPQSSQKLQLDALSSQSSRINSAPAASTSTPVAALSSTPQESRVPAQPSEKAIRGIQEVELSAESMPPPAYSLEPESPIQTGEISQESVAVINSPSSTGLENQENRYSPSRTEVVRQEEEDYMPDIILPKKKKKKSWKLTDLFMRRSKKNTGAVLEL